MPRRVSEQEFNALSEALIQTAPKGMSEPEFERWYGPRFAAAIGEAEHTPEPKKGSGVWGALTTFAETANPWPVVKALADVPLIIAGLPDSGNAKGLLESLVSAHVETGKKAVDAAKQGRIPEAIGYGATTAVPMAGPMVATLAEDVREGRYAEGIGRAAALALPGAIAKVRGVKIPAVARNANPTEAAAVKFGMDRGIPVDAGTASGNRMVRNVQQITEHSTPVGAVLAERTQMNRANALRRVGGELADDVNQPSPNTLGQTGGKVVTPEQAGRGVAETGVKKVQALDSLADKSYEKLRAIEADPKHARTVLTAAEGSPAYNKILGKLKADMPEGMREMMPTREDLVRMRQIEIELDAQPFVKRTWNEAQRKSGNAAGGDYDITPGSAGASVYDDIMDKAPGSSKMTRGEVQAAITKTLETGEWTNASIGAFAVARGRAGRDLSAGPRLTPGGPLLGGSQSIGLAVDLADAKKALTPLRDSIARKKELTGVLMGDEARAAVALDSLIGGPDVAPLSVVDAALSDLKAMARGKSPVLPELRSKGQGAAAFAVQQLDAQVRATAAKAGPQVLQALETGRKATTGKYIVGEILKKLQDEPVKAFQRSTAPGDSAVNLLHQIKRIAPDELPNIGRALVESLLQKSEEGGRFVHADAVWRDWSKIGPETRRLLFRNETTLANLDKFFLLNKRLAESANPSKSGFVGATIAAGSTMMVSPLWGSVYQLGGSTLAALAHSPRFVRAFTRGASIPIANKAAAATATAELVAAAREAGVTLPMAAEDQERTPAAIGQR